MKKIFAVAAAVIMLTTVFTGCKSDDAEIGSDEGRISVISTIFSSYDFAKEIGGDKANVSLLMTPGSESHYFEPTPKDIIDIQNSDIFIYVGGESDVWVEEILESIDTSGTEVITLIDCVEAVEEVIVEGMEEEEEEEEEGVVYDEHVWTSPANAKLITDKITAAFSKADAENADFYSGNADTYKIKLDELDEKFLNAVNNSDRNTIVIGDRFPFRYLTDAYGLLYHAAFPGCATETEASPATIKFLIDKVNEEEIPVVFHIELSNQKIANTVAEATGAKVMRLHACHNLSKEDFDNGKTYLDFMEENVIALEEALK